MSETPNTYQPGWGEPKKKHHHHHLHSSDDRYTNSWGGSMKMKDKQAYYGLMVIVLVCLAFGAYKLVMMFVNEWRAMPHDDPTTEMKVDALRIHKVDEQDALLLADSLAQTASLDSIRHTVQIETRPVYRLPRREDKWYITQREWKEIWRYIKRWRKSRQNDKQFEEE